MKGESYDFEAQMKNKREKRKNMQFSIFWSQNGGRWEHNPRD